MELSVSCSSVIDSTAGSGSRRQTTADQAEVPTMTSPVTRIDEVGS
jgi:hypothetical protein